MVPPPFPHKQYLRFVPNKAGRYGGLRTHNRHFHVWCRLKATNLDAAYPIVNFRPTWVHRFSAKMVHWQG